MTLRTQAYQLLTALRTLAGIEAEQRSPTAAEREALAAFPGFGCLALDLFPHAVTGAYKSADWAAMGATLQGLLTPADYVSAKRTVFFQYFTPPLLMQTLFAALRQFGVPEDALVFEPGYGAGGFLAHAPAAMRFVGVELDQVSARIAQALYPQHALRQGDITKCALVDGSVDAAIGNPPFGDLPAEAWGLRLALHEYCLARAVDALAPGGCLALVMTHSLLDKQHTAFRQQLAARTTLLGALRLPAEAFEAEGTRVVTDLLFMQKVPSPHDPAWLATAALLIEGSAIPINQYFLDHPEHVLGTWTRQDRLYGRADGYSVRGQGDLAVHLAAALAQLPSNVWRHSEGTPETRPRPSIPVSPSLSEGSFFVTDTGAICQVQDGEGHAVVYGGKALTTTTGVIGRRLAALIGIRDATRAVLAAQQAHRPPHERDTAREGLRQRYRAFVTTYGPINTVTCMAAAEGTVIRRLPNLVVFRRDPDAMLVMALEEYDEETGTVQEAPLLTEDVLGEVPSVTHVASAEHGLLVTLNTTGIVDIPAISRLYGKERRDVCAELGDLIYQDPRTQQWQTADIYLSGNVRVKLQQALGAGEAYARNVTALRRVQPRDLLPGEIDANLGAPWIPAQDVALFAQELFDVRDFHLQVAHSPQEALWSVEASAWARGCSKAVNDYGTRDMDGCTLLAHALNLTLPTVYDRVWEDGKEKRVLHQAKTVASREKLAAIKRAFQAWLWTEPSRAERLVQAYNEAYNAVRLRGFDGNHLDFPGMNPRVRLYPHQKHAIWRIMSGGNTLLAHQVGSGKSYVQMAAAMKMRQAGLIRKPLFCIPNHLLEQFARECQQLYPNARLLLATREDFGRDQRKLLTARIAASTWDGILTTHSSFERIGMSVDFQSRFLQQKIAAYEALLVGYAQPPAGEARAMRNIIKSLEKHKARYEAKLEAMAAAEKKDDGLVFDELGIDYLFVDESTYGKNLETPSKMTNIAGIQSQGSQRALDLAMKIAYLEEQHPGHGVTFATGTPITNTMVELYTLQQFLDPATLKAAGIAHFDAWAASFGEVVELMEISPDGKTLRPRSRFAKFTNVPELIQMFRGFADVQTAAQLQLPVPALAGGKAEIIACPMSPTQQRLQEGLVRRYERVRNGQVRAFEDNALAITTDGRKLALDAQMLSAEAGDFPGSKLNALVQQVWEIWAQTTPQRATQLIFADLGVHPTAWGFGLYATVTEKLHQAGVPLAEIAAIGEADTDAKKHRLFEQVRHGQVRILLGSTAKMGLGTNVQQRLLALHHLDAPWKPSEVEQREGRILRQGNMHPQVSIYRYVTEGSFDAFMWQALETKARFIAQILTGTLTTRQAEDLSSAELTYAEVKAIASGNPAMVTLAETEAELRRLALLHQHFQETQYVIRLGTLHLPDDIAAGQHRLAALEADWATVQEASAEVYTIAGRALTAAQCLLAVGQRLETLPLSRLQQDIPLGQYRGGEFGLHSSGSHMLEVYLQREATITTPLARQARGPRAILNALGRLVDGYASAIARLRYDLDLRQTRLGTYRLQSQQTFAHADYQAALQQCCDDLRHALAAHDPEVRDGIPAHVTAIAAVRATAAHHAETVIRTTHDRQAPIEAITTQIQRRAQQAQPPEPPTLPPLIPAPQILSSRSLGAPRRRVASDAAQLNLFAR